MKPEAASLTEILKCPSKGTTDVPCNTLKEQSAILQDAVHLFSRRPQQVCAPAGRPESWGGVSGSTTRPGVLLCASLCSPAQHLWALQGRTCSISYEATSMAIYITVYQLDFLIGICFTN